MSKDKAEEFFYERGGERHHADLHEPILAGDQLQSSCPTAVPKSPVARVDTVETRLTAMADAIKSVRPDLQNFYAPLSDEQKARFNTMGSPPKDASSPQQRQSGSQR